MTEQEKHIEIVKYNIELCEHVILRAELANKGRHTHFINSTLGRLKPLVRTAKSKKPKNVSKEELVEFCKLSQAIGHSLWLLSEGK